MVNVRRLCNWLWSMSEDFVIGYGQCQKIVQLVMVNVRRLCNWLWSMSEDYVIGYGQCQKIV